MSSIGAISSVSISPAAGANASRSAGGIGNSGQAGPAGVGGGHGTGGIGKGVNVGHGGYSGAHGASGVSNCVSNRGMYSNMSSTDFISLSQLVQSGDMKGLKEMVNLMLALKILEQTMEAVGDIIDKFITGD